MVPLINLIIFLKWFYIIIPLTHWSSMLVVPLPSLLIFLLIRFAPINIHCPLYMTNVEQPYWNINQPEFWGLIPDDTIRTAQLSVFPGAMKEPAHLRSDWWYTRETDARTRTSSDHSTDRSSSAHIPQSKLDK